MPTKPKPPPGDRIALAAELRAGGATWDAVAAKVGRSADTVRKWPALYPDRWKAATRAAERQLLAEATAESVHTLRRQLRSEDEKASRDAARSLIQFRVALGKRPRRTGKKPAPATADAGRIAAHLEGLTDAELDALIAELGPAGRGPAHPPGP